MSNSKKITVSLKLFTFYSISSTTGLPSKMSSPRARVLSFRHFELFRHDGRANIFSQANIFFGQANIYLAVQIHFFAGLPRSNCSTACATTLQLPLLPHALSSCNVFCWYIFYLVIPTLMNATSSGYLGAYSGGNSRRVSKAEKPQNLGLLCHVRSTISLHVTVTVVFNDDI